MFYSKGITIACILLFPSMGLSSEIGAAELLEKSLKKEYALAIRGDVCAQYALGLLYKLKKDGPEAFKWLSKAATKGCDDALFEVAICHLNGIGVSKDDEMCIVVLKELALRKHPQAMNMLGKLYLTKGANHEKASSELFELAAIDGFPEAYWNLAMLMEQGRLAHSRLGTEMELLNKAADLGSSDAMVYLAIKYTQVGNGNKAAVRQLYEKAAALESTRAQVNLGAIILSDKGNEGLEEASILFMSAAKHGDLFGCANLAECYHKKGRSNIEIAQWYLVASSFGWKGDASVFNAVRGRMTNEEWNNAVSEAKKRVSEIDANANYLELKSILKKCDELRQKYSNKTMTR